jgi:hypothetical protein
MLKPLRAADGAGASQQIVETMKPDFARDQMSGQIVRSAVGTLVRFGAMAT